MMALVRLLATAALAALALGAGGAPPAEAPVQQARPRGPLQDVGARMEGVQDRLDKEDTGDAVRAEQKEIVARLDAIIELLQKQAAAQAGGRQGREGQPGQTAQAVPGPARGAQPEKPAERSTMPPGEWEGRAPGAEGGLEGGWMANLPPAEREKVQQAFKEGRLPMRYQGLIQAYSRRLAEEQR